MVNHSKRQTLIAFTSGIVGMAAPLQAWSASNTAIETDSTRLRIVDELTDVSIVVSTFGKGSAVITITNRSANVITAKSLEQGIVMHDNVRFDINASLGKAGVTLKPGQRRIVVAQPVKPSLLQA